MASTIDIKDVKTSTDVDRLCLEQCTTRGLQVSLWTYLTGIIAIPLAMRNVHKRIPIGIEYKLAIGAVAAIAVSFFAGTYTKSRCENNLKKQLKEVHGIAIP